MNDPNLENLRILEFVLQNVNLKGGGAGCFFFFFPLRNGCACTCVLLDYVRVQTGATHLTTVSFNYTSNPKLQSSLKMREGCMKLQTAYKVDS